jgi:N-dimethylarginine dimethylaminohydrolase
MCPPTHFAVLYEINPWMHRDVVIDLGLAQAQWDHVRSTLQQAGAQVDVLDPVEGLPDLVFTANAGIVNGRQFIPSNFRHPQRRGENEPDAAWFAGHGWRVDHLPEGVNHEGAGDALPFGDVEVSAYPWRSDARSHAEVARLTGATVLSVELTDPRLYHLDLTFCPLDGRRAIVAPAAWSEASRRALGELVPQALALDLDETLDFTANSVVVGTTVVMSSCPPRVGRQLEAWGFDVVVVDVTEFQKAGGGVRCLTLALDVVLPA